MSEAQEGRQSGEPAEDGQRFVFELATFLLTAARGCVDEPPIYGPLRLVDGVSRLADIYDHVDCIESDSFLLRAKERIDERKFDVMASEERFVDFLDDLIEEFGDEIAGRYQTEG